MVYADGRSSGHPHVLVKTFFAVFTENPLYTDTRYKNKSHYNDNLNVKKPSLKRLQLMRNYARILR